MEILIFASFIGIGIWIFGLLLGTDKKQKDHEVAHRLRTETRLRDEFYQSRKSRSENEDTDVDEYVAKHLRKYDDNVGFLKIVWAICIGVIGIIIFFFLLKNA